MVPNNSAYTGCSSHSGPANCCANCIDTSRPQQWGPIDRFLADIVVINNIHTSIVSRYLATRGNNNILRTPPPHISSTEQILPRLTRHTLAQVRTNKCLFLKSYLHKVDAKSHHHYAPSAAPTHTTHAISSTALTYAPYCHP